jgi:hypothetical protein
LAAHSADAVIALTQDILVPSNEAQQRERDNALDAKTLLSIEIANLEAARWAGS